MLLTLYERHAFSSVREELPHGDDNFRLFQDALMANPRAGDQIQGAHGAHKVRWHDPLRGKGKRGGIRIIYFYQEEMSRVLLIAGYTKQIADLTETQTRDIGRVVLGFRDWRERAPDR
jgi:mRNA-degrading endonuclease RelE of RelBE toxin-antitoxin system